MKKTIYQYSSELKGFIWLANTSCTGPLEIPFFPEGSFTYYLHLYMLYGDWSSFITSVKQMIIFNFIYE